MSTPSNKPNAGATGPGFKCPSGTKVHILNLGVFRADEAWVIRGANGGTVGNPNPEHKHRDLMAVAALIDHPQAGLLLFETGGPENVDEKWGVPMTDVFPRVKYSEKNKLPTAINAAGYDIRDVKGVIMGHLHLDHAGGLEHFVNTDVPIYVHELELKHACWAVATNADIGVYMADYLNLQGLNWKTFHEAHLDLFEGITIYHTPGHTPGLCMMQVNLELDGTFIFTTDQYHVKENYTHRLPQGWLARDHDDWFRSLNMTERLQRLYNAKLVFGHDFETADELIKAKKYYE